MTDPAPDPAAALPLYLTRYRRERDQPVADAYAAMTEALRALLDTAAAARPDPATAARIEAELRELAAALAPFGVNEWHQLAGRIDAPGAGRAVMPPIVIETEDRNTINASVCFGRAFLGGNGAAHGGMVTLVFDDLLGRLASTAKRRPARTAYLHVDYRRITPIERPLQLRGWFEKEEGRKRLLRGELRDGDAICAEAEGLFVELLPGQP